jgi:hypothetical protein
MSKSKKSGQPEDKAMNAAANAEATAELMKPAARTQRTPEAVQAMIDSMTLEKVPIEELHEFEMNPRSHGEDVSFLVSSISGFGWTNPILAQRGTGRVIAGHGRLLAAREKGLKILPVIFFDYDDTEATAYTITDNASAEHSEWNFGNLETLLRDLQIDGFDLEMTGLEKGMLDSLTMEDGPVKGKQFDESVATGVDVMVTYKIKIAADDSEEFELALTDLLEQYPAAKMERSQ